MPTITTPRPPLFLLRAERVAITDAWTTVYEPPQYQIPASGPVAAATRTTAMVITNALLRNTSGGAATWSLRITSGGSDYVLHEDVAIADGAFAHITEANKAILETAEVIAAKMDTGNTGLMHLSFMLQTAEPFEVIV